MFSIPHHCFVAKYDSVVENVRMQHFLSQKMLENRPNDALGSLVETVETVETV